MSATVMPTPQLSLSRLLLLGASSVILCLGFVTAIFSPFPLALSIIMYGRVRGYMVALLALAMSFLIATVFFGDLTLFGFYSCVVLFAAGISETLKRDFSPLKGMVFIGLSFVLVTSAGFAWMMKELKATPEQFFIQQIQKSSGQLAEKKKIIEQSEDKDAIQVLQLLDRPDLLAKEMIESFPSLFFIGVFVLLWFNMFLALKSRRLLFSGNSYKYDEKCLLHFKVPFGFVLVLVIGLVLATWGDQLGTLPYELIGFTIIKCLGIFYFFQGFGVFNDLLNFLGLYGFFRILIVIATIFTGSYLIATVGLFDNWFEFRKYFVKRKTED